MKKTNECLVSEIRSGISAEAAKSQLCDQNKGLIMMIVNRLQGMGEREDLIQEGFIGLLEAAETYDPEKGAKFSSYAANYIFMRIYRNNSFTIKIPEYMKTKLNQYKQFLDSYQIEYGTQPDDNEIMYCLGISQRELQAIRAATAVSVCSSLQSVIGGEDGDITLQDIIADKENVEEKAIEAEYQNELKRTIWKEVEALPEDQAETIRGKYLESKTIKEISESIPAAQTAEAKALKRLRRSKNLKAYFEEIRSLAMQGTGYNNFNQTWTSATERTAFRDMGI